MVQQRERGQVVAVYTKVIFGEAEWFTARLQQSSTSQTINSSFVERENLIFLIFQKVQRYCILTTQEIDEIESVYG